MSSARLTLVVGGMAASATLALLPVDRLLATQLERHPHGDEDLGDAAKSLAFLGGPAPFLVGGALLLAAPSLDKRR